MTAAVFDPAPMVARAGAEFLDHLRDLVDRGEPDDVPGLLDEVAKLLRSARDKVNRARKRAAAPSEPPASTEPTTKPAPPTAAPPASGPPAEPARPAATPRVTLTLPDATSPRHQAFSQPTTQQGAPMSQPQQPPPAQHWQQAPPPRQQVRRRRRIWPWVLIGLVVLIAGGCVAVLAQTGKEIKQQSRPVLVTYEVTGQGVTTANNITYVKDVNLGQEQLTAATPLPWKHDVQFGEGFFKPISIVAQAGDGAGAITCRIVVDGKEVATSTSQGQFAVVTCSGDVPKP